MAEGVEMYWAKTKIHAALLLKIKNRVSVGLTGNQAYYIKPLDADTVIAKITSEKDQKTITDNEYDRALVFSANSQETTGEGKPITSPANQIYIKLGLLLSIINKELRTADTPFFSFDLTSDGNRYRTIDGHLSVDPYVCLLPSTIAGLTGDTNTIATPLVYNLWLNVDFVTATLDRFINSDATVALLDFFETLFSDIERVTGGINKYELQYFEETSTFRVVDRNFLTPKTSTSYPVINVYGLNSIVKNVNLVTKISPKLSSMVAISAQASPFTSTMEGTGFGALQADLESAVKEQLADSSNTVNGVSIDAKTTTYKEVLAAFEKDMQTLLTHIRAIYELRLLKLTDAYNAAALYQNYCNLIIGKKQDPAYSFIIPFELSLTFNGVSGLRVLESFKINKNILPYTYGGNPSVDVAFVITGVEHQVSRGQWNTNIKTQIYHVNEKGTLNNGEDYTVYWEKLLNVSGFQSGGETGQGGSGNSGGSGGAQAGEVDVTPTYNNAARKKVIDLYGWPIDVVERNGRYYARPLGTDTGGSYYYSIRSTYRQTYFKKFEHPLKTFASLHEDFHEPLKKVLDSIQAAKLTDGIKTLDATPYARDTRGKNKGLLSGHSFGVAIDVNAGSFPQGQKGYDTYLAAVADSKNPLYKQAQVVKLFIDSGEFNWGGNFSGTKDAHHFTIKKVGSL